MSGYQIGGWLFVIGAILFGVAIAGGLRMLRDARKRADDTLAPLGLRIPDPPPMPQVRAAVLAMREAHQATQAGANAWNELQIRVAIHNTRFWLDQAEASLPTPGDKTP